MYFLFVLEILKKPQRKISRLWLLWNNKSLLAGPRCEDTLNSRVPFFNEVIVFAIVIEDSGWCVFVHTGATSQLQ